MYSETSLQELWQRVAETRRQSRDLIVPATALSVDYCWHHRPEPDSESVKQWAPQLRLSNNSVAGAMHYPLSAVLNDVACDQLAYRLGIPRSYFSTCYWADTEKLRARESRPRILLDNVRYWLSADPSRQLMLRTLEDPSGNDALCRAVLSNRYLRIDNEPVLTAAVSGMQDAGREGGFRIETLSGGLTDSRMYLTMLFPDYKVDLGCGDVVRPGLTLKNSEVGLGSISCHAFLYRDRCTNGMVFGKTDLIGFDRRHVGSVRQAGLMSPETHQRLSDLMVSQVRDAARAMVDPDRLESLVRPIRAARDSENVSHPLAAFEELARVVDLRKDERDAAIENFIREADYTRFGMSQAVTRLANAQPAEGRGFDRTMELAEMGAEIISLPARQWDRVRRAEKANA